MFTQREQIEKPIKDALSGLRQLLATENPSKNGEKCFISPQNLAHDIFCLDFLVM